MSDSGFSRRHFFFGSLLAGAVPGAGFGSVASLKQLGYKSPNEKLNIAAVGAGGKGRSDITGCQSENIVAMADPDWAKAEGMFKLHEKAAKYKDYRQMLDKEGRHIDAVTVSTPDHTHAPAAIYAMERGKHVYCQKPLTHSVWEARRMSEVAAKYGVATQMGNQGYSNEGARQCCEIIWSGEIGTVSEVHAWTNRPGWPQGPEVAPKEAPVPATLDWDLWLGTAAMRPYSPSYVPFSWRGFYDFGCGALGDMACHILGTPNMALQLGAPMSVECVMQEGSNQLTFPKKSVIRFDFPARGSMPAVKIVWHDGLKAVPAIEGVPAGEQLGDKDTNGSLFIGSKGMVTTGCYGERTRLIPVAKMDDYKMPAQLLTRSPGHYRDWIRAAKGGAAACSNFGVAGPFTEWILLGVIALRVPGKLEWDAAKMRFTNSAAANKMLKPFVRKGWKIG
ncbi:MAG: Gfo/Idh/MocA family oxidoreductase [Acidobacteria bacterium]|nr:Gfo/Idh/MocA family oxidoreductase [Acidobacteriota bacterium]